MLNSFGPIYCRIGNCQKIVYPILLSMFEKPAGVQITDWPLCTTNLLKPIDLSTLAQAQMLVMYIIFLGTLVDSPNSVVVECKHFWYSPVLFLVYNQMLRKK